MNDKRDNDLGERIKKTRQAKGMTITDLCRRAKISRPYYYNVEKGISTPSREIVDKIASALHVSPDVLLSDVQVARKRNDVDLKERRIIKAIDIIRIPILGEVRGGLSMFAAGNIEGYTTQDIQSLNSDKTYFALRVIGDSMDKLIREGDLVIVEQTNTVETGDIAIVLMNDDESTIKRIKYVNNLIALVPESYNPAYEPQLISPEMVQIIGKVIESKRSF